MNIDQLSAGTLRTHRVMHKRETSLTFDLGSARSGRAAAVVSRGLDVVVSALLLCVLALPMLLIALLVKLTSRGPVVYMQERAGLGGKPFVIFKFRTMRADAEAESGPIWAKSSDPRRTAIGIVLRRFCLDELPQLFNVLRGEMSLVGPRPERPCFVRKFAQRLPAYHQRHQVLPGITGWAQINGWRGNSSIEERLEFDLFYVRNWSVLFDLKILLLTPIRVLVEKNGC